MILGTGTIPSLLEEAGSRFADRRTVQLRGPSPEVLSDDEVAGFMGGSLARVMKVGVPV